MMKRLQKEKFNKIKEREMEREAKAQAEAELRAGVVSGKYKCDMSYMFLFLLF